MHHEIGRLTKDRVVQYFRGDKMNIGENLKKLRKEKGLSQEQLADILNVSRQSVSKWESDLAYPETEKLIKLANLYDISIDSLLRPEQNENTNHENEPTYVYKAFRYEYKSKKTLFGIPLVHINLGRGLYVSKGIISIGNISFGVLSLGLLSMGIFSLGTLSIGLIGLGVFVLALLLAVGSIAVGAVAIGAIAVGFFTIGALSIGYFSVGALSIAKYVAIGDTARGLIAIGQSDASGTYAFTGSVNKEEISQLIDTHVPSTWEVFKSWIKSLL